MSDQTTFGTPAIPQARTTPPLNSGMRERPERGGVTTIWLVVGKCGEYDTARRWIVCGYANEADAVARMESAQAAADALIKKYGLKWSDAVKAGNPHDPKFATHFTGTEYEVESVEMMPTDGRNP